jgi:hypothetical protein
MVVGCMLIVADLADEGVRCPPGLDGWLAL